MGSPRWSLIKLLQSELTDIRTGVEIGVWQGATSVALLEAFPKLELRMVDPWHELHEDTPNTTARQLEAAKQLAIERTDTYHDRRLLIPMPSLEAVNHVADNSLDFGFLDACRLYEYVKPDTEAWYQKIRPGGVFCGHDYTGWGVRNRGGEVKPAVDEFAARHDYEVGTWRSDIWWIKKRGKA